MKFELKQQVEISRSGETGIIVCRMDATDSKDQFKVQYKAADGRAVEGWFFASELKAVKAEKPAKKVPAAKETKHGPESKKVAKKVPAKKKPVKKKVRSKKTAKKV